MAELCEGIKPGAFVKLKGMTMIDRFDGELTIGSLVGLKKISDFTHSRQDHSLRKRVELHCHTKMSDMDGVSEVKDIVKRAYEWGHPAIAITDHGVAQAFPDANHLIDDLWKAEKKKRQEAGDEHPDRNDFFKVIYGMEAYLVDDLKEIVTNGKGQPLDGRYVVFDIETTGFSPVKNRIIEIGAVKVEVEKGAGRITDRFSVFVNPQVPIPFEIEKLTGINDEMVAGAEPSKWCCRSFWPSVKAVCWWRTTRALIPVLSGKTRPDSPFLLPIPMWTRWGSQECCFPIRRSIPWTRWRRPLGFPWKTTIARWTTRRPRRRSSSASAECSWRTAGIPWRR